MRAICAKGKQAESPVRGKFTPVWWGAEVEERQELCCRGHSLRTGQGRQSQRELHVLLREKKKVARP